MSKNKSWSRFKSNKRGYISFWLLVIMYFISLFSEFVANEKPLVIRINNKLCFPIVFDYSEDELFNNGSELIVHSYKDITSYDWVIYPIVKSSPDTIYTEKDIEKYRRHKVTITPRNISSAFQVDKDYNILFKLGDNVSIDELEAFKDDSKLIEHLNRRFTNTSDKEYTQISHNKEYFWLAEYSCGIDSPKDLRINYTKTFDIEANSFYIQKSDSLNFSSLTEKIKNSSLLLEEKNIKNFESALKSINNNEYVKPFFLINNDNIPIAQVKVEKESISWPFRPIPGHLLGFDAAGRDVFTRLLYGMRTSITFGIVLVFFSMLIGIIAGAIQGYFAGSVDLIGQRLTEIISSIPIIYLIIFLGNIFGRSFLLLLICYTLFNWIGAAAYIRAEFLKLRNREFVDAAKCLGLPNRIIIFKHILPNSLTPLISIFPFSLVGAIGALTMLDYLGFGMPDTVASWGALLQQAQVYRSSWWLILYPSLSLFVVMLLGVFIGEGLRDALDPREYSNME